VLLRLLSDQVLSFFSIFWFLCFLSCCFCLTHSSARFLIAMVITEQMYIWVSLWWNCDAVIRECAPFDNKEAICVVFFLFLHVFIRRIETAIFQRSLRHFETFTIVQHRTFVVTSTSHKSQFCLKNANSQADKSTKKR